MLDQHDVTHDLFPTVEQNPPTVGRQIEVLRAGDPVSEVDRSDRSGALACEIREAEVGGGSRSVNVVNAVASDTPPGKRAHALDNGDSFAARDRHFPDRPALAALDPDVERLPVG